MRDMLAIEVIVLAMAAYLGAMYGLSLLIGGWTFAILAPTIIPAIFGSCWLADRVASPT